MIYCWVIFRDGPGPYDSLLAQFCDSLKNVSTVLSTTGRTAYVRFRSDVSATASGFQLHWETQYVG